MKYIDSEKLIDEIERRMEERYDARTISGKCKLLYKKFPIKLEYSGFTFNNLILNILHLLVKLFTNVFLHHELLINLLNLFPNSLSDDLIFKSSIEII